MAKRPHVIRRHDIKGTRFGRLVALQFVDLNSSRGSRWLFQCDCGNQPTILHHSVSLGFTKSCGCLNNDTRHKPASVVSRIRRSVTHKQRVLDGKNHLWRGGVTSIHRALRNSLSYKLWREAVFSRDDYRCLDCGQRGGVLNADHIYPFSSYPRLRFMVENGRALCEDCHKNTNTFGSKAKRLIGITS